MGYCVICGYKNEDDARFCVNCGVVITTETQAMPIEEQTTGETVVKAEKQTSTKRKQTGAKRTKNEQIDNIGQEEEKEQVTEHNEESPKTDDKADADSNFAEEMTEFVETDHQNVRNPEQIDRYIPPFAVGVPEYKPPEYKPPEYRYPANVQPENTNPISTAAYFWLEVLYLIPGIGLIMAIILSTAPSNISLKRFSRASLLLKIVIFVFALIVVLAALIFIQRFGWPFRYSWRWLDERDFSYFGWNPNLTYNGGL